MNMKNIENIIKEFSQQRDWDKFHNPKNISMALSVEASELLEIFQWLDFEQSENLSPEKHQHAREEIADIAVYLIRMCMTLNINLEDAIKDKMKLNEIKYPLKDKDGNKINYGTKN